MSNFKNVNVEKTANIYFDGKVISRNIKFNDGSIKTLGVMLPGEYEFNTSSKEIMDIISGKLSYQLNDQSEWTNISANMSFNVPKGTSFKVKVMDIVNYCCTYID